MANDDDETGQDDPTDASRYLEPAGIETYASRPLDISALIDQGEILARNDVTGAKAGASPRPAKPGAGKASDLVVKHSLPDRIGLGAPLAVGIAVEYQGKPVKPADKQIKTTIFGKDHFGPFVFVPVQTMGNAERKIDVATTVEFQHDKKTTLPPARKRSRVEVFCAQLTSGLSPVHRLLTCAIYSEGGSRKIFNEDELLAIGWCIQNRVDYVITEADLWAAKKAQGKQDEADRLRSDLDPRAQRGQQGIRVSDRQVSPRAASSPSVAVSAAT